MVKEGEKTDHVKHHEPDHIIHERKLRYYKKTVQLLTFALEMFFLFFLGAVIFLFVAGDNASTFESDNSALVQENNQLKNQILELQDVVSAREIIENQPIIPIPSASIPMTSSQIDEGNLIYTFSLLDGSMMNFTVSIDSVVSQIQSGYLKRELVDKVSIPMHTKYAQTCFDFVLYCADSPEDYDELKEYYATELQSLQSLGSNYLVYPLGATTKTVIDFRDYVSSDDFVDEIYLLYNSRSGDGEFITQLWNIVSQLTSFSSEIKETPLYPLETLFLAGGDCEDSAILMASLLDAANTDWEISFLYTDLDSPAKPYKFNHVLVHIDTGNEEFFVETTSKDVMNPYPSVTGAYALIN